MVKARRRAPKMDTTERVEKFAQPALMDIFYSLDVAEFQQEYELAFQDESQTYFPYDLIFGCVAVTTLRFRFRLRVTPPA